MDCRIERCRWWVPTENPRRDDHVTAAADREQFGEALHEREGGDLDDVHGGVCNLSVNLLSNRMLASPLRNSSL